MIKQVKAPPENHLPQCLYLALDSEIKRSHELRLKVTAHFHEEIIDEGGWLGTVAVSLKGGDLLLDLDGIEFLQHSKYGAFSLKVAKRTSRSIGGVRKRQSDHVSKPSASLNVSAVPKFEMATAEELKTSSSDEDTEQQSDEATYDSWQLHALGGPKPGWRFSLKTGESFLEGSLMGEELCVCRLSGQTGQIEAKFTVHPRFIRMNVLTGPFAAKGLYDLTDPKKTKLFNLLLWKRVVQPHFQTHLSRAAISYE